ncbi:MAG: UDP-glucose 4-epimerase GalE [Candidatus Acidiferrum sp.]
MERVLVTGGAGYVGSACAARLLALGHSVDVMDDLSTGHVSSIPSGASFHKLDIGDREGLDGLLSKKSFDVVFHFAAKALIPESVTNPGVFFDTNVARSLAMLEVLRQHEIHRFIFSSTAAVYGNPKTVPIPEDHEKSPVNSYGESKLMFEQILERYAAAYGWGVVAFRYFNACGGAHNWGERHEPETHIIPLLMQVASGRRETFHLYGTDWPTPDGTNLRDYVHVGDIAEAHILAMKALDPSSFQIFNIGTGASHSVREVWSLAEKTTGRKIRVQVGGRRLGDPAVLCADATNLKKKLGWQPAQSNLESILAGAWEWEKVLSGQTVNAGEVL